MWPWRDLQWAERLLQGGETEQWGDKWEERFKEGKGTKKVCDPAYRIQRLWVQHQCGLTCLSFLYGLLINPPMSEDRTRKCGCNPHPLISASLMHVLLMNLIEMESLKLAVSQHALWYRA